MSAIKKLAGQTAIYGLSTIVGRLLNYLLVPLYTYHFSPSEYGVVTEMYAYVSFLVIVLTYGMETALFNFSVLEKDKEKVYSTSLISIVVSSLCFILLLYLLKEPIARIIRYPEHSEYITWFALILAFDAISNIAFAKLRELNKAKRFAFVRIMNITVNIGCNVFFIVLCPKIMHHPDHFLFPLVEKIYDPGVGVGYAFISTLIASLVTLIFLFPEIFKIKFHFDSALWKRMMIYALPLLVAGLAGMTNETIDRILLKYLLPSDIANEQNGIYGACYKVSIIMSMFIQTFRYASEPFFFSQVKSGNAQKTYAQVMTYFVIICSLIFLGTMMNISWIQYFVGAKYRSGLGVVPILLLANMFLGITISLSIWYKLTGKTRFGVYLTVFGAAITLIGNFIFIPKYGYMASAWVTLICYASMMVLSYLVGNKHYPVNYQLKRILGYLALSLALYFISIYIPVQGVPGLVINNLLLLVFVVVVYVSEKPSFNLKNENQDHQ